jgi:hypothetical protein
MNFEAEGEGFALLKRWRCWAEKVLRLRCAPLRMTGFFDIFTLKPVAIIFRGLIFWCCGRQVLRMAMAFLR